MVSYSCVVLCFWSQSLTFLLLEGLRRLKSEKNKKFESQKSGLLGLLIKVLSIFRLYQKDTATVFLILHQLNLYILLICGKKVGND